MTIMTNNIIYIITEYMLANLWGHVAHFDVTLAPVSTGVHIGALRDGVPICPEILE